MKSTIKTVLISVAVCLVFGLITIGIVGGILDINTAIFSSPAQVEVTHEVEESFDSIHIKDIECDIRLYISPDGVAKVITTESNHIYNTVDVESDTLIVTRRDERRWYERIGISWQNEPSVEVYLPEKEYDTLILKSISGDIKVSDRFDFSRAELISTSGEIYFSGDVLYDLYAESTSGDIVLNDITADTAEINNVSGDIEITAVVANKVISLDSVSGDMELRACDAQSLDLNNVSGDIDAVLLSDKDFYTETTSGKVYTSEPDKSAGRCNASTVSGDIFITVH